MDIDLYKTFLAIADTGSFTAAARQVARSQSAVSQQIKRLEDALGQPLFERTTGNVDLTEYGKSLLGFARGIVDIQSQAMAAFNRGSFEGIVVVGIPDAYLKRVHKDVVAEFSSLYPQATLNVVIDESAALARRISDGSVDLAFVTEGSCSTCGPVVFRDRLVVVGSVDGDLHKADPLPLSVWDERNIHEGVLIAALETMNRRYRVAHICRSALAQHAVIAAGLCAAVMTESSMIEGERAYLEKDGFPVLRELKIRLERAPAKKSRVIDRLERHFLEFFGQ
ncbi:MAG: LysR family transcriptional regulator [Aestuariivirga sp.]